MLSGHLLCISLTARILFPQKHDFVLASEVMVVSYHRSHSVSTQASYRFNLLVYT